MVIIYEPNAEAVKKKAKKYLKADNQNIGVFRNIILTLGFLSLKNKKKEDRIIRRLYIGKLFWGKRIHNKIQSYKRNNN